MARKGVRSASRSRLDPSQAEAPFFSGSMDIHKPVLFEVAWEVCNKVGGIYTVISTKAPVTLREWGNNFCFIGPYFADKAANEFEPLDSSDILGPVITRLWSSHGIRAHYGRWLIDGNPRVLLLELNGQNREMLHDFKVQLWDRCQQPLPDTDAECNNCAYFGASLHRVCEVLYSEYANIDVVMHFHEWQASVGLSLLKWDFPNMAVLFTTHATLLGRYMCAGEVPDFYNNLPTYDSDKEARARNIFHKHLIEKSAARECHVFSTVSEITGLEAEHLLGRKPDYILYNGLQVEQYEALHEFQVQHARSKGKLHDFVRGHFHGWLDFDIDQTLYFFIAGRNEYLNKGVDMFIEALYHLNQRLINDGSKVTVVAFLIMPAPTNSFNVDTLRGQNLVRKARDECEQIVAEINDILFDCVTRCAIPDSENLLTPQNLLALKRRILSLRRDNLPPIVTHNMVDGENDRILCHLRRRNLCNNSRDRVKVIYHPEFLNASNPILSLDYNEFVRGCHLGVFPSYYEPFGYTPAECAVMGVPAVTSNLSGFANFIEHSNPNDHEAHGIFVVDRRFRGPGESINQLTNFLLRICLMSRRDRIQLRNRTERLSLKLGWDVLGRGYTDARNDAIRRRNAARQH